MAYIEVSNYDDFIERFEEWCSPTDLERLKKEPELLHDKLAEWFNSMAKDKPWLRWQPTQSQFNVFADEYDTDRINVGEDTKRYENKYEFDTDEYFYRRDKNVYADIKKDKIYEGTQETTVNFKYGERVVLRDSKGRFIKHIKDSRTGFWLI